MCVCVDVIYCGFWCCDAEIHWSCWICGDPNTFEGWNIKLILTDHHISVLRFPYTPASLWWLVATWDGEKVATFEVAESGDMQYAVHVHVPIHIMSY